MAAIERQSSQEIDVQQIKRELYDSKEREADLRDQLKFLEDDGKKMRKKLRDLEDENDNMSKHLKKMTVQHALLSKLHSETGNETNDTAEANIEQKVQYELLEEELSVLKKKMADLEEENEMLHQEMFVLEKKIKEKDHQLQLPAEPTSPNTFYEDKIKEYEKEADEFRWKILEKEKEIEQLYGQLKAVESRKSKGLRKTRSLDSSSVTMDSDYSQIVDLKRQLEFSQQESNVLRDKVISLEAENSALCSEIEILKLQTQQQTESPLRTLAVAYVDTENETHLRAQIKQMVSDRTALVEKIATLSNKCSLLTKTHYPHFYEKMLPTVPYDIVSGMHTCEAEPRDSMPNYSRLKTLTMETSGNDLIVSSNMAASQKITEVETRDPEKLLSDIDESFCVLMQGIVSMDSDEEKVVRTDSDSLLGGQPPDIPSSSVSRSEDDEKMSSEPVSAERDHLMDKILDLEEEVGKCQLFLDPVMRKLALVH